MELFFVAEHVFYLCLRWNSISPVERVDWNRACGEKMAPKASRTKHKKDSSGVITMMMATTPQTPPAAPLDTMKDKVQSLLKEYAPSEFLDDKEAREYLTSLLAASAEEQSHENLVELIQGFFGDDHQEEASQLVEKVSKLSLTEASREAEVPETRRVPPTAPTRLGDQHQQEQ